MRETSRRSSLPPAWLWTLWAVTLVGLILLRATDVVGDRGLVNVATMLGLAAVGLVSLLWFTLASGHRRALRLGTLATVVAVVLAAGWAFELEGVTSELVPRLRLRFTGDRGPGPATPATAATGIDLGRETPRDFPGFLGPGRDLRVDGVMLARDWQERPPELLWRQEVGAGWSGFAVVNGYAATLEQRGDEEMVTLYEVASGRLLWAHSLPGRFESVIAGVGPRSTPTIAGGIVYALSVRGVLLALDGATGEPIWRRDLLQEYGIDRQQEAEALPYGRPNSPLVVGGKVIVPVGGPPGDRVSLAAFDAVTGDLLWEGGEAQIAMASPAFAELAGRAQVLSVNQDVVTGHDPDTGEVLWDFPWPGKSYSDASVSQPVPVPPDRVFVSKGYGQGAALYRLVPTGDGTFEPRRLWHEPGVLRTKLTNVAVRDGHVYGLSEGILECVELETGARVWKRGRYRHGQILLVGDLLLVLTEDGEVVLVEATPDRADHVLGRFQAVDGHTWNNLALYGDVLLVRNAREMAAWRLPVEGPVAWR